jgi:hypothetical protein
MLPNRPQTSIVAIVATFLTAQPAMAERECRPDPVFLNIDDSSSVGDAHIYLSSKQDFRRHPWGSIEIMKPFSELTQTTATTGVVRHRLPGVSILIPAKADSTNSYFDFPIVRLEHDPNRPAGCVYSVNIPPTASNYLSLPRQFSPHCKSPPTQNVLGRTVYRSVVVKACHGQMEYGIPNEPVQKIHLGTLALVFSDDFLMFRNYFLPGALTSFEASLVGDEIAGGGVTLTDMLNSAGGYVYRVSINMPYEREENIR